MTKPDIGVRLSIRLLLPYCTPACDVRIVATLAETLERHVPQSDAETSGLIEHCKNLLRQKSVRVLDGCVNLCLCRYRQYLADQRPGGAMHWLLQGLQLEVLVFGEDATELSDSPSSSNPWEQLAASGTCYRMLVTWCLTTSQSLLKLLVGDPCHDALVREAAGEMVASIAENNEDVTEISEVSLLKLVYAMIHAFTEKQDVIVAHKIVECLEETVNDDGIVSALAHSSMSWNLLRLALIILHSDEQNPSSSFESSFDVHGIQTLLTCLTHVTVGTTTTGAVDDASRSKLVQEMRLAFGKGLMRAMVSENKRRKPKNESTRNPLQDFRSVHLGRLSLADQEKVVTMMLDS